MASAGSNQFGLDADAVGGDRRRLSASDTSAASVAHILLADAQTLPPRHTTAGAGSDNTTTTTPKGSGAGDTTRDASKTPVSDDQKSAFQDSYDVKITEVQTNGKPEFEYTLDADGQHMALLRTDASKAGLESAGQKLDAMALAMATKMESDPDHLVRFSRPGEEIVKKKVLKTDGTYSDDGPMVIARAPKLDELYGIQAALKHSQPSNLSKDGTPVKIYFLSDMFIEGLGLNVAAQVIDKNKQEAIYISPEGARLSEAKPTEADLTDAERAKTWDVRKPTIESDLVHEFAHVEQNELGLLKRGNDLDDATAAKMGWVHFVDDQQEIDLWMIKLRDTDKNEKNILYRPDETSPFGAWIRCNEKGLPLNAKGEPAVGEQQSLSAAEVMSKALIKPPTWYFPNPCEEYAEAMKLYRLSESTRSTLLENSPVLYRTMKENDQAELDLHFHGAMIRALDGSIGAKSPDSLRIVQEFENKVTEQF